jgi:hypothetical protein
MDADDDRIPSESPRPERPLWAWLSMAGGVVFGLLVSVTVIELSLRPLDKRSADRPAPMAAASTPSPDDQLAVAPPPPPIAPPPAEDAVPPTVGPPGSPPQGPPPSGPPIWPPTQPPSDMRGAGVGVPGPSQAIRPEPQPRRLAPRAPAPSSNAPRGGRDG